MNYCDITEINTPRLTLRKLKLSDAERFYEFAKDIRVSKYMNWITHSSVYDSENSIKRSIEAYEKGKYYRWGIALKENDTLIGIIQLLSFDEKRNSCSFAYMLSCEHWGNGYGTEALSAVIGFAFDSMAVDIIEADIFSENIASSKVLEKCGMTYTDTIKDKYEKNGAFHNADKYVITRDKYYSP
ncbi:MAG: GNAT family N-acetyltransferase [Ruminococcaceae bacterium]|nr:GNAT family N-acetyltransferase [Oscillospiraceae bacterium]